MVLNVQNLVKEYPSIKAVNDLIDTDSIFKDTVAELEKKVELSLMA